MSLIPPQMPGAPVPPTAPGVRLPTRAFAARLCLLIGAPVGFLAGITVSATDGHVSALGGLAGLVAAAAMVFVGTRVAGDHQPAGDGVGGATVRRCSRWDWSDVVAFLPATLAALVVTDTILVGLTQVLDRGLSAPARSAVEAFAQEAAFYAAALIALAVIVVLRRGLRPADLGWRLPRAIGRAGWWPWLAIALAATGVALYATVQLGHLAERLLPNAQNTQCTAVRDAYGGYLAVAIPLVCVIAPAVEETVFRGFLYGWLRRHLAVAPAVVICAAVFALSHRVPLLALPLFAVGVVLALLYEYSESLIPGAVVHSLFNLVGIIAILGTTTTC